MKIRLSAVKLRRWWKPAHRWVGLTLGWILILAAFTGSLMTVARPLDEWVHADLFRVAPSTHLEAGHASHRIELGSTGDETVLERVRQRLVAEFGAGSGLRLRLPQQPDESLSVRVSGPWGGMIHFHPRTAAELGRRSDQHTLVNLLFELHSTLLMGDTGKATLAVASIAYLFLLITGLVLWWPARWRHAWGVKWQAGTTRAPFDVHRVGGSLLGLLIAVSVVSGAYMVWRPLSVAVTALSGKPVLVPPRLSLAPASGLTATRAAPLDRHVLNARAAMRAGRATLVQVSAQPGLPVRVRWKLPDDPHPVGMSSVWLHPVTAQVLAVQHLDQLDPGMRAFAVMYPLHIGALGGPLHTLATAILGLALTGLGVSGMWLWWLRRKV